MTKGVGHFFRSLFSLWGFDLAWAKLCRLKCAQPEKLNFRFIFEGGADVLLGDYA
jgi:hypothetical protein